ncbi:MAG: hypothetical protein IT372_42205 [Polyangiaceae bacterium]|nr:hypothetical protein [Polyangiaceae bacterium]
MCCFMEPVQRVYGTRIFAAMAGAEQVVVYDARVVTKSRNAMVLPVPVRPGAQGAVELIDLSRHEGFFDSLAALFPELWVHGGLGMESPRTLDVVRVGAFEASVVPTIDEFSRLSRRFSIGGRSSLLPWRRRGGGLLAVLRERYADHAFVVYQIAPGESRLHPFAFRFTSRYPYLFFPTLHVHDRTAPEQELFDHELYAQRATLYERTPGTVQQLGGMGLPWFVDPHLPLDRARIVGMHPNRDSFAALDG